VTRHHPNVTRISLKVCGCGCEGAGVRTEEGERDGGIRHKSWSKCIAFLNFQTLTSAKQEETVADPAVAPSAASRPTREASKQHLATRSARWSGVSLPSASSLAAMT